MSEYVFVAPAKLSQSNEKTSAAQKEVGDRDTGTVFCFFFRLQKSEN